MMHRATMRCAVPRASKLLLVLLCIAAPACSPDGSSGVGAKNEGQQVAWSALGASAATGASRSAAGEHQFFVVDGKATARSTSQRLWTSLSGGALGLWPDEEPRRWHALLRWTAVGRGAQLEAVPPPPLEPQLQGERASYHRPGWGEEWYVNEPKGIEQGFVLWNRPSGNEGMLVLEVKVEGSLAPSASADGSYVVLRNSGGLPVLRYSNLVAVDAQGAMLPSHMQVADGAIWLHVDDHRAQYPLMIDPLIWRESTKRTASDAEGGDFFGISVAVSGNRAIVGARGEDDGGSNAGAAYVLYRDEGGAESWGQVAKLTASDAQADDWFGGAVSISGDTAIVGAHQEDSGGSNAGAAYLFYRNAGGAESWGQVAKLTAGDAQANHFFGYSVAVSGDTVIVGARYSGMSTGAAYIFDRNTGGADGWGQVAKLTAGDAQSDDLFAQSVALHNDTALVGAPFHNAAGFSRAGVVFVFSRNEGGENHWGQVARVAASDAAAWDRFGQSVSISDDSAVVGAPGRDEEGNEVGVAYVLQRDQGGPNSWGESAKLRASDGKHEDGFGNTASIHGDTVLVGAPYGYDSGIRVGVTYLFRRDQGGPNSWGQSAKIAASDAQGDDEFGRSVSIGADAAIIGQPYGDEGAANAGAVYLLRLAHSEGDGCAAGTECHSGYCVDDFCCNEACIRPCMACSSSLSVGADGECAFVPPGQDPDGNCEAGISACDGQGGCKLIDGQPCEGKDQCVSGHCVDGVCCGSPCDHRCEACSAAILGGGQDGHCQFIPEGKDPDSDCAPDTSSLCGADGLCNGGGQCRAFAPEGTLCGEPNCERGTELPAPLCDGAGVCEQSEPRDCFPFVCNPERNVCLSSCSSRTDCEGNVFCSEAGLCVPGGACLDEDTSLLDTGATVKCAPYLCSEESGSCKERCASTADCSKGYICTSNEQCVPFVGQPEEAGGCGCSLPGQGRSPHTWLLLLLAGVSIVFFRHREKNHDA